MATSVSRFPGLLVLLVLCGSQLDLLCPRAEASGATRIRPRAQPSLSTPSFDQERLDSGLRLAAKDGRTRDVLRALELGADVNGASPYGHSALLYAAMSGHAQVVRVLLERGARIDQADDRDNTPLYVAAYNCNNAVVELLLRAGANVNRPNRHGQTPLMNASEQGCAKTVQILLAAPGIDVNATNHWFKTALDYASEGAISVGDGFTQIVEWLSDSGARQKPLAEPHPRPRPRAVRTPRPMPLR